MLFLLGPLAILTGVNYELGVRRYAVVMRKILIFCGIFFPAAIALVIAVTFLPERFLGIFGDPGKMLFRAENGYIFLMLAGVTALAVAGIFFCLGHRRFPVWVQIVLISFGIGILGVVIRQPYRMMDRDWRDFGRDVRAVVPDGTEKVYKYNIDGMYCGLFYCGLPVHELKSLNILEKLEDTVYLISSEVPVYPDRVWTPLLPEGYACRGVEVSVWRGVRRSDEFAGGSDE